MKYTINIQLLDYWQISSGKSTGMDADIIPVLDQDQFPFIPGRVIKGLFKDAFYMQHFDLRRKHGNWQTSKEHPIKVEQHLEDQFQLLFGKGYDDNTGEESSSFFGNVSLPLVVRQRLNEKQLTSFLFKKIAFTAIDEQQTALENSLRKIQYCVPMKLTGNITVADETLGQVLMNCAGMIKKVGMARQKGFGRCVVNLIQN